MTGYEYALRTVTVASGQEFQIAHAVAPGTLVALCGTVAIPQPGSRWTDSDPNARCEACERSTRPAPSLSDVPSGRRRLSRRVQFGGGTALIVVAVLIVVVLSASGGFQADPNTPAYKNGYAYGHDLMVHSNDVATSCTRAAVDDPASTDGKNFIAGCEAGYAARTP